MARNSKHITNLFKKLSVDSVDLSGKTALIIGGNEGIGLYTAINLAKMNCKVIIASRNSEKSESAVEKIKQESNNSNIDYELVDLLDFSNIREFAKLISEKLTSLDYLILNSGATFYEFGESKDGIEKTIQLNHLGHLLLTMSLLPIIKKADKARIIIVSSGSHLDTKLNLPQDLRPTVDTFSGYLLYCKSKLMNVMTAKELSKRLANDDITIVSLHPGFVATDVIVTNLPQNTWQGTLIWAVSRTLHYLLGRTPDQGSLTTVYTVIDENIKSGAYYDSCELSEHNPQVDDDEICKQLFEESLKIIKFKEDSE